MNIRRRDKTWSGYLICHWSSSRSWARRSLLIIYYSAIIVLQPVIMSPLKRLTAHQNSPTKEQIAHRARGTQRTMVWSLSSESSPFAKKLPQRHSSSQVAWCSDILAHLLPSSGWMEETFTREKQAFVKHGPRFWWNANLILETSLVLSSNNPRSKGLFTELGT